MKKLSTVICCVMLATYGFLVGKTNTPVATITAAPSMLDLNRIPYDLRPTRTVTDTVFVDSSSTKRPTKIIKVVKKKIVRDTVYLEIAPLEVHLHNCTKRMYEPDTIHSKSIPDTTKNVLLTVE